MAKKELLLFVAILSLFVYSVNAEGSFQRGELEEGESKIFNMSEGFYILTLVTVSDQANAVIFRLNNEMSGRLREKESYTFNDGSEIVIREVISNEAGDGEDFAGYYFYVSGKEPMNVRLHSINSSVCDFDRKCENEREEYCCYDCGCNGGYDCIENVCSERCERDAECDDFDGCTTDSCVGGECKYSRKDGCELGNGCVEKGYIDNEEYCIGNEWTAQKKGDAGCSDDYECVSGKCKGDKCVKKTESKGIILFALILLLLIIVAYTRKDYIIRKLRRRVI